MEAIKKKMNLLKEKLQEAENEAQKAEDELTAKNNEADMAEEEVLSKTKELNDIEDELEKEEENFITLKARFDEACKLQDENERAHKELSNRGQVDNVKLDRLEGEFGDLQAKIEDVEEKYQSAVQKLEKSEDELESEEVRFSESDMRVKELEVEAVQAGNLLRSMEINEDNAAKSQSSSSTKVEDMKNKVDDIIEAAEKKEAESQDLEKELNKLDDDVQDSRERYHQVKAEYDALLAEVAEI